MDECNDLGPDDQLWEDIAKLNSLYEELMWGHDDTLVFTHDGKRVIIYNETLESNDRQT